jgi:methyltransferase-like protein
MKTAFSYDTMPYPSKFFLQTHPDRLATIGTFYGMNPPKIETCRLLDLGCGNGSNLIAHAFRLPEAEFVGVDLSGKHIKHAQETAQELNIENIEFHEMDVLEMSVEEFGKFDYIIAHGLFAWVPEIVREKVLALYREMLVENGIGYISYNAYPGAHYRELVREMMLFDTKETEDPMEKVGNAITFLTSLMKNATETKAFKPLLLSELKRHFEHDAADIFHDDLAEFYQPFYFHEFVSRLEENDLQFLAEAELHAMSLGTFPPNVRNFIEKYENIIEREQYSDFFRGRTFRQTLFCHKNIELDRNLGLEKIDKFLIASSLNPVSVNPDIALQIPQRFVSSKGVGMEIDHPLTKAALFYLGESWGRAVPFETLLNEAKQILEKEGGWIESWEKEVNTTRAILTQIGTSTDMVELHLFQPEANITASEKPKISSLARWQLQEANNVSTLLNLDLKIDDEVSRQLLKFMDGTRNKEDLVKEISEFIKTDEKIDDKQDLLDNLESWVEDSTAQLTKLGMFVS